MSAKLRDGSTTGTCHARWFSGDSRMRQVPGYQLWLGHVGDARDLRTVISTGIMALVDLAVNEPPATVTRDLVYCRFPLLDFDDAKCLQIVCCET